MSTQGCVGYKNVTNLCTCGDVYQLRFSVRSKDHPYTIDATEFTYFIQKNIRIIVKLGDMMKDSNLSGWIFGSLFILLAGFLLIIADLTSAEEYHIRDSHTKRGQVQEISTEALASPATISVSRQIADNLETGFENSEGFTASTHCAQNGWTKIAPSNDEGHIDTSSPASGTQHIRISYDTAVADGTFTGCLSPDLGPLPEQSSIAQVYMALSATGGADYDFWLQAPSQGFVTARVKFFYLGDIFVLDVDEDDNLDFVDTGVDWDVGMYRQIRVEVNPASDQIQYFYNDSLIYTGSIFAGTVIEQAVLMSDNWHLTDVGDFDNLTITTVIPPSISRVYLPAIMKPGFPPDSWPVLSAIDNVDGNGNYNVSWNTVNNATSYILEESTSSAFSDPTVVYSGPDTSVSITGKGKGIYHYRVKAANNFGSSDWSDSFSVEVSESIAGVPCLLIIEKLRGGENRWFNGCTRPGNSSSEISVRYDSFGGISGFDQVISDSQGVAYYWASIDVERDGFGRVDTYDGTISSLDFPSFTQHIEDMYNTYGQVSRADGIKVYTDNDEYTMENIDPCGSSGWVGYHVNVTGGQYSGDLLTVGNCN